MMLSESFADILAWGFAAIVGVVLLWTAGTKVAAPHTFRRHLASLGWIPAPLLSTAVTIAAALEAGWGTLLVVGIARHVTLPLSILALVTLSAIAWWGVRTGKADDCGCYGGFIQPSIEQSLLLNSVFIALLGASLILSNTQRQSRPLQFIAIVGATFIAGGLAEYAQRFQQTRGIPRFTPSPLKEGAAWKHSWARNLTRDVEGEMIVSMLGPDCPFCKQWVKVGNAMSQSPALPKVFGVLGASSTRRDEFVGEHQIRFPVASISQSLMGRLAQAVPTTLLIEDGRIKRMWVGSMPPEFVERFRRAFFPDDLVNSFRPKQPGQSAGSVLDTST